MGEEREIYCVKCKEKVKVTDYTEETTKNNLLGVRTKCPKCSGNIYGIVGSAKKKETTTEEKPEETPPTE